MPLTPGESSGLRRQVSGRFGSLQLTGDDVLAKSPKNAADGLIATGFESHLDPRGEFRANAGWTFARNSFLGNHRSTLCWRKQRLGRTKRAPLIAIGTIAAIGVLTCWMWLDARSPSRFGPTLELADRLVLEQQGAGLRAMIETYRATNGRYPTSLAEAGARPEELETKFGAWMLMTFAGADVYELGVGDYARHGFRLWWNSREGEWYWDE